MKRMILLAMIVSPFTAFAASEAGMWEGKDGSYFSCKVSGSSNGTKVIEPLTAGSVFPGGKTKLLVKENGCSPLGKFTPWSNLKAKDAAVQMAQLTGNYVAGDVAVQTAQPETPAGEKAPESSK